MKKILIIINSQQMDLNAVLFACHVAKLSGSDLSAFFLENIVVEKREAVLNEDNFLSNDFRIYNQKVQIREDNISLFKGIVEQEGINAQVRFETGVPLIEVLSASRFADVVIVDPSTSFSKTDSNMPTQFVRDLLQGACCPVILVPEEFDFIDNILFFYDGSKSSIFAIKQFTYLFPELHGRKAKVLYMNKDA
ncbi:MAG: hypothetical protein JST96_08650, partial [Bacteroidetes bacterium]|nr:hypothetical protein [Bacteroidota bacterium]